MKHKTVYKLEFFKLFIYDLLIFINSLLESTYNDIDSVAKILKLLRYVVIGMLFGMFLLTKKQNKDQLIISVIMLVCCIVNYILKNGSISFMMTICVFLVCRGISTEKIVKHTILTVVVSYGFVIVSCLCGIIKNIKFERWLSVGVWQGRYERQALGFQFPNQIPLMYFYVVGVIIIGLKKQLKLSHVATMMAVNIIIYLLCNARTPFILVAFMLVTAFMLNRWKAKILSIFPLVLIFAFFIGSFVLSIGYLALGDFTMKLDRILNSRLSSAYLTFKYWGVTFFGSGVEAGTKSTGLVNTFSRNFLINVDNGYLIFLLQYGLILTLCIMFIISLYSLKIYKNSDTYMSLVISLILISNLIDANFDSFRMWPFILILAADNKIEANTFMNLLIMLTKKRKKHKLA